MEGVWQDIGCRKNLNFRPSSVIKMVQKLAKEKYLIYEKYRGITLTPSGYELGKHLVARHKMLESLFRIINVDEETIHEGIEGIEHHLSQGTLDRIIELV